ncbi:threonine/serine dehydratase [Deinococcus pimensis]|uniref:threonine/serine dehydratase n=1 Tax=Deinococcus pimensis TaxID=309888 RepID=UPI0004B7950F|nr:threonine/serine dehydratase [Deinococcus pimensis]
MTSPRRIREAMNRIRPYVRTTPIMHLHGGELNLPCPVTLKFEQLQHTGSFKVRGAFNALLALDVPSEVVTASEGNHGAAVAYAARALGREARVFVPSSVPPLKRDHIERHGARVVQHGREFAEAADACEAYAWNAGALNVHAFQNLAVIAGQGTLALELEQQAPELDTLLVAVGGGGLIGGMGAWYDGRVKLVGVEPSGCAPMRAALAAGAPVDVPVDGFGADSLGCRRVGRVAFDLTRRFVDAVVLVDVAAIMLAQRQLWDDLRVLAEPGGVVALAALLSGAYVPAPGERLGVIVSGGYVSPRELEASYFTTTFKNRRSREDVGVDG